MPLRTGFAASITAVTVRAAGSQKYLKSASRDSRVCVHVGGPRNEDGLATGGVKAGLTRPSVSDGLPKHRPPDICLDFRGSSKTQQEY